MYNLLFLLLVISVNTQNITQQLYSGSSGSLLNGFQNWSWATVNLQDKTVVRPSSTYSISVVIQQYQAAYFHGDFYMPVNSLPQLSFWINGGTNGGQDVTIRVTSGANAVGSGLSVATLIGKPIPANQWVQVIIPFSSFQITQNVMLDGLQIQSNSATNQGTIYLDGIEFVISLPSSAPVSVTVQNTNPISVSPYIYGVNFATAEQLQDMKYPVNRWGGNAVTRYDYILDTANHASDWYFENIPNDLPDPSKLPDGSQNYVFIKNTTSMGAKVLLTTPIIGWRPKDRQKRCGFDVAKYGAQQAIDPYDSSCGNGLKSDGSKVTGNDAHDTSTETDPSYNVGWIKYLDKTFGDKTVRWFQMDNEPGLWSSTHRDVHPNPLTYDELWNKTLYYGGALKTAFPDSLIFGPISWGYCAYVFSDADGCTDGPDRKAHGDLPFIQWYMQQIINNKKTSGQQVVDVIDIHYYPQADGVTSNKEDPLTGLVRLRSPKGLWDTTYIDESWISKPIAILQYIDDWTASIAPGGFRKAVSEYSFGDDSLITTALATAEALSVFAKKSVFVSSIWVVPGTGTITEDAFKLYLNYDGKGSRVSGSYISATVSDDELVYSHAYVDEKSTTLYVIIINKVSTGVVPVTVDVSSLGTSGIVNYYTFQKGQHIRDNGSGAVSGGKFVFQAPAWSATVAVFKYK